MFAHALSCILVAIYSSNAEYKAGAFLILLNWCLIVASTLWLSALNTTTKLTLIAVLVAVAALLGSKSITWQKSRLVRAEPPQIQAIETWLIKTSSILKYICRRITKTKLVKVPKWKLPELEVHRGIAGILDKLSSPGKGLAMGPVKMAHALLEAVLKGSVAVEAYVDSLIGNIVALLIESTTRFSWIEKRVGGAFHSVSLHVERLQHEVERALLLLFSLMSILLLAAIILYVMYTAQLT